MVLARPVLYAVAGLIALTSASPLNKRIAQVISDSTQQWVQACKAAGGTDSCGTTSQTAFMTLLANAGDCDQQNAADSMIDLAKSLNNNPQMISLAQVFVQQPRNTPNKLSVNYCQQQPKNAELNGLFQCQFQGADPTTFTNNVKVGGPGTIPLGLSAPLNPPGSCKAHPQGGIADGTQLVALTQDPGLNNNVGAGASNLSSSIPSNTLVSIPPASVTATQPAMNTPIQDAGAQTLASVDPNAPPPCPSTPLSIPAPSSPPPSPSPTIPSSSPPSPNTSSPVNADSGFQLQNGKDAQALNAKFATLTPDSSCKTGDQGCINQGFAQCVQNKFAIVQCAGGLQCFALPLVNKAGTSIACTTPSDALSRIQASGATGNVTGT